MNLFSVYLDFFVVIPAPVQSFNRWITVYHFKLASSNFRKFLKKLWVGKQFRFGVRMSPTICKRLWKVQNMFLILKKKVYLEEKMCVIAWCIIYLEFERSQHCHFPKQLVIFLSHAWWNIAWVGGLFLKLISLMLINWRMSWNVTC